MKPERAVEMTGAWKTRKTKPRFPFLSHGPWKSLRDSHIPTAPTIFVSQSLQNQIKKGDPGGGSLRSRLQAHSSMRKCLSVCGEEFVRWPTSVLPRIQKM